MRCAVEGEPDPQGPIKEQCLGNSNHIKAITEQRQKPPSPNNGFTLPTKGQALRMNTAPNAADRRSIEHES